MNLNIPGLQEHLDKLDKMYDHMASMDTNLQATVGAMAVFIEQLAKTNELLAQILEAVND